MADETDGAQEKAASVRDQDGRRRDFAAIARDLAGTQRDEEAEDRDLLATDRAAETSHRFPVDGDRRLSRSMLDALWESAAADRERSRQDRLAGAGDRDEAARDRVDALADRSASARDRHHASRDALTGVYGRQAGLLELERDLDRARRAGHHLVLAFVDVDGLKAVNDAEGHAAGNRMLVGVADTLGAALRPHDLIIRYGGDEFLCAVSGIDIEMARPRFARVNTLLAGNSSGASVTVGIAQLQLHDSCASLIARADEDLYGQRRHR